VAVGALIRLLRPRAYLLAHDPGLEDGERRLREASGLLHEAGYCVEDVGELDAADFGVAQRRRRRLVFGHLKGACVRWPLATHANPEHLRGALPEIETRKPWQSAREALAGIPASDAGRVVRPRGFTAAGERGNEPEAVSSSSPWPWDAPCRQSGAVADSLLGTGPRRRGPSCWPNGPLGFSRVFRDVVPRRSVKPRSMEAARPGIPPAMGRALAESLLAQRAF